jgi:hypothetical protein
MRIGSASSPALRPPTGSLEAGLAGEVRHDARGHGCLQRHKRHSLGWNGRIMTSIMPLLYDAPTGAHRS